MKNIEVVEWDSRSSLADFLAGSREEAIILETVETPRRFYSLSVRRSGTEWRLGISSAYLGIKPVAIQIRDDCVLVGYDQIVTAVDLATGRVKFEIRLVGAFYHFITLNKCQHFIIVSELGLTKLSVSGQLAWTIQTDIIERVERDTDHLVIKIMGNPKPIMVSIDSGKTIE